MKYVITTVVAFTLGLAIGWFVAYERAQVAILSGPYSDHYDPAISDLEKAMAALDGEDAEVREHIESAQEHIVASRDWARHYLGNDADP